MSNYRAKSSTGKSRFFSRSNYPTGIFTPTGSRLSKNYLVSIDPVTGQSFLKEVGYVDDYAQIQSYKDDCLIENILSRIQNGEEDVLKEGGQYGDFTRVPKNLIEARQQLADINNWFNSQSVDFRAIYHNDLDYFLANYDFFVEKKEKESDIKKKERKDKDYKYSNDTNNSNNVNKDKDINTNDSNNVKKGFDKENAHVI